MSETSVVVIGGGPTGLATACALREHGVERVVVVEREAQAGGIPRHSDHTGYGIKDLHRLLSGPAYAAKWTERAATLGVQLMTATTVTGWNSDLIVDVTSREGRTSLPADAVVLATGCRERPRAARLVPGERPAGVMTTGQLQQLVHVHHRSPGTRAIVVGAEHVSYSAVMTLAEGDCRTVAMVTHHRKHTSFRVFDTAARLRYTFPLLAETFVSDIRGSGRVEEVEVTHKGTGQTRTFACDTIVFTGSWIADHELASRHDIATDAASTGIVVDAGGRTNQPGVFAAGNVVHPAETADVCTADGRHVAKSVVGWLGSGSWPERSVPVAVRSPLVWVSPQQVTDHLTPPRGTFVLRAEVFARRPRIVVSQADRMLWTAHVPRLIPDRTISISARWLSDAQVSHGSPPIIISTA